MVQGPALKDHIKRLDELRRELDRLREHIEHATGLERRALSDRRLTPRHTPDRRTVR